MGSFAIAVGCDELSLARGKGLRSPKCEDKADKADKAGVTALMGRKKSGASKQSESLSQKPFSQKPFSLKKEREKWHRIG